MTSKIDARQKIFSSALPATLLPYGLTPTLGTSHSIDAGILKPLRSSEPPRPRAWLVGPLACDIQKAGRNHAKRSRSKLARVRWRVSDQLRWRCFLRRSRRTNGSSCGHRVEGKRGGLGPAVCCGGAQSSARFFLGLFRS